MVEAAHKSGGDLPSGLTVTEFLAWSKDRPGRFELHDGQVVAMAAERVRHANVKFAIQRALDDALRGAMLDCHMLPDGVAVHIDDKRWYEPDALVYCGAKVQDDAIAVDNPVIVIEVVSPSTGQNDEVRKLVGYGSVPSIVHYLIVYPDGPPLVYHRRQGDGSFLTRIVAGGPLRLDPPGIEVDVATFFG